MVPLGEIVTHKAGVTARTTRARRDVAHDDIVSSNSFALRGERSTSRRGPSGGALRPVAASCLHPLPEGLRMDAPAPRYQTGIEVASLIVGPALMSIGDLFHPPESWDVAAQYSMIAATSASGRWHMAHLLLFIGMLLFVPGILAMTRVVANRSPAAGYAARILLLIAVGALSCRLLV
jgi:hypothetical protein